MILSLLPTIPEYSLRALLLVFPSASVQSINDVKQEGISLLEDHTTILRYEFKESPWNLDQRAHSFT